MKKIINILVLIFTNFICIHSGTTISQAFKQAKGQDFFLVLENYPSNSQPNGDVYIADGKYNGDYYFMLNTKYKIPNGVSNVSQSSVPSYLLDLVTPHWGGKLPASNHILKFNVPASARCHNGLIKSDPAIQTNLSNALKQNFNNEIKNDISKKLLAFSLFNQCFDAGSSSSKQSFYMNIFNNYCNSGATPGFYDYLKLLIYEGNSDCSSQENQSNYDATFLKYALQNLDNYKNQEDKLSQVQEISKPSIYALLYLAYQIINETKSNGLINKSMKFDVIDCPYNVTKYAIENELGLPTCYNLDGQSYCTFLNNSYSLISNIDPCGYGENMDGCDLNENQKQTFSFQKSPDKMNFYYYAIKYALKFASTFGLLHQGQQKIAMDVKKKINFNALDGTSHNYSLYDLLSMLKNEIGKTSENSFGAKIKDSVDFFINNVSPYWDKDLPEKTGLDEDGPALPTIPKITSFQPFWEGVKDVTSIVYQNPVCIDPCKNGDGMKKYLECWNPFNRCPGTEQKGTSIRPTCKFSCMNPSTYGPWRPWMNPGYCYYRKNGQSWRTSFKVNYCGPKDINGGVYEVEGYNSCKDIPGYIYDSCSNNITTKNIIPDSDIWPNNGPKSKIDIVNNTPKSNKNVINSIPKLPSGNASGYCYYKKDGELYMGNAVSDCFTECPVVNGYDYNQCNNKILTKKLIS